MLLGLNKNTLVEGIIRFGLYPYLCNVHPKVTFNDHLMFKMVCVKPEEICRSLFFKNSDMIAITAEKSPVFVLRDKTTSQMRKVELH